MCRKKFPELALLKARYARLIAARTRLQDFAVNIHRLGARQRKFIALVAEKN